MKFWTYSIKDGISASEVGRRYNVNESTIHTIRNNMDIIRQSVRATGDATTKLTCKLRPSTVLEKVEKLLSE